jgi:hypothetical protein
MTRRRWGASITAEPLVGSARAPGPACSTVLARNGNAEPAADALERLSEIARAGGTDGALGVEAARERC